MVVVVVGGGIIGGVIGKCVGLKGFIIRYKMFHSLEVCWTLLISVGLFMLTVLKYNSGVDVDRVVTI